MNLAYAGLWAAGMAVLVIQRALLGNRGQVWLGAILPGLWMLAGTVLIVRGGAHGFRIWLALAAGLVLLIGAWIGGQEARKKRLQREDERIDALNNSGNTSQLVNGHQAPQS